MKPLRILPLAVAAIACSLLLSAEALAGVPLHLTIPASPAGKNPNEAALKALIDSGIRMLEAEEYLPLLQRIMAPKDRKKFLESGGEEFVTTFKEEKAEVLLAALRTARRLKPKYNKAGDKATFTFRKKIDGRSKIEFMLVDGVWYLQN